MFNVSFSLLSLQALVVIRMPVVIACRVSPNQKANIVKMVKRYLREHPKHNKDKANNSLLASSKTPVTLAIGDGANDVGMIHEAQIGIGISGCEGKHAANASDFSIPEFQYLGRLLLVHGRMSYHRTSLVILYSFFKNLALVSLLFYYSFFNGFSGTSLYESIIYGGYNFFLGLPIICVGVFHTDISDLFCMKFPFLSYQSSSKNFTSPLLSPRNMIFWSIRAFLVGIVVYALTVRFIAVDHKFFSNKESGVFTMMNEDKHGVEGGLYAFGFYIYSILIVIMQAKIFFITATINWVLLACWGISLAGFVLFAYIYSLFPSVYDWYQVPSFCFTMPSYWLAILLVPVALLLIDEGFLSATRERFVLGSTYDDVIQRKYIFWWSYQQKKESLIQESMSHKVVLTPTFSLNQPLYSSEDLNDQL